MQNGLTWTGTRVKQRTKTLNLIMVLDRRLRCLAAGLPLRRLAGYNRHLAGYSGFSGLNGIAAALPSSYTRI
jgi:hypothetical protein